MVAGSAEHLAVGLECCLVASWVASLAAWTANWMAGTLVDLKAAYWGYWMAGSSEERSVAEKAGDWVVATAAH